MSDSARFIGKLTELSALDDANLGAQYGLELLQELAQQASLAIDSYEFPTELSESDFVLLIRDLKENQKEWSWSLAEAFVRADELLKANNRSSAINVLEDFIGICPWNFYRLQAHGQLERIAAR